MSITRIEKYVKVTDDWYPTFPDNKVRVALILNDLDHKGYKFVRICAWGADDFGLEMDFEGTSEENELKFNEWRDNIYHRIPDLCNKEYFENLGFYPA